MLKRAIDLLATSVSLESNTSLRTLSFGSPEAGDSSPRWIDLILSQVTSKQVSEISLELDITDEKNIRMGDWDGIFRQIESDRFASLKKVEITMTERSKLLMLSFQPLIKDKLPKLEKNGILNFR